MALDPANTWGQQCADAAAAVGITAGAQVTPAQLAAFWTSIKNIDRTQLTTKAVTKSSGATAAHAPGTPAGIVQLPGVIE